MKNLLFALDVLADLSGHVELDIFGPLDDQNYWNECAERIESLPDNVIARYWGPVPHQFVAKVAAAYDFFLLPTQGENFGYVLLEAMAAGCPIIVSDRTPWQQAAEQGAGWCLPLEKRELWRRVLQSCVHMDPDAYASYSSRARKFVEEWAASSNHLEETIQLFNAALDLEAHADVPTSLGAAPSKL
jgi:glycosyltransferase involved in cell wall biosynthesis